MIVPLPEEISLGCGRVLSVGTDDWRGPTAAGMEQLGVLGAQSGVRIQLMCRPRSVNDLPGVVAGMKGGENGDCPACLVLSYHTMRAAPTETIGSHW
jgi:hypothetical protein